jgi:hypothetical protein
VVAPAAASRAQAAGLFFHLFFHLTAGR